LAECLGGVSWRSVLAECLGGVSWRSVLAECLGGVSWRSVLAECLGGGGLAGDHEGGRSPGWRDRFSNLSHVRCADGEREPGCGGRVMGAGTLRPTTVYGPYRAGAIWGPKPRPSAWAGRTSPTGSLRGKSLLLGIALPDSTAVLPCLCQRPRNPSPGLWPLSPRGRVSCRSDLAERLGGATWRSDLAERVGGACWRSSANGSMNSDPTAGRFRAGVRCGRQLGGVIWRSDLAK
jgi:hypothetical protein